MPAELLSFSLLTFSAIFFIVDPLLAVPLFLTITTGDTEQKRRSTARKAALVVGGVLTFFALGGGVLFKLFGVTLPAFQIAGGVLLGLTALDQLRSEPAKTRTSEAELQEGVEKQDVAIVPLAMPILAGPGSIATVMLLTAKSTKLWEILPILASIWLTALICWLVLRGASFIDRVLGRTGRAILERVFGLLLAAIAVQFVVDGLREALPLLAGAPS